MEEARVHAFRIPTDGPGGVEQDGTLEWSAATVVLVRLRAAGHEGIGFTYGDVSVAAFAASPLVPVARGADALAPPALWSRMPEAICDAGRPGAGAMALSAVDVAAWDFEARLLGLPLTGPLPAFHERVPVHGSGGFTN
ncbi:hypothetical protein RM780_05995 [Streptomyces sp. DSM 44917]|uniref:Mandelate racemase/muconate lactonizing enzyme N-terminal domain-containing protein n=1 Tax=Streptomyces boetiae TaxID=3075541 RepID=A0ABU2L4M6_9ACTN|nr:hypothetical protein [Streptomyces sp. DSM 44917]MDT0306511.1 hypothetical protein [Streptomyces sp. DSM 44917]